MSLEFTFECPLTAGLHARPASLFSEIANGFACDCTLTNLRSGASANGKSTLSIIGADVRKDDNCRVVCAGPDESAARAALQGFVNDKLAAVDDAAAPALVTNSRLPRALRDSGCRFLTGTGASDGIGVGVAVFAGHAGWPVLEPTHTFANPALERERITLALAAVGNRIGSLLARAKSETESAILKAHLAILRDVSLIGQIDEFISQGEPAESAVVHAAEHFRDVLRSSASAYIRERALDLQDVARRLLEQLGVATAKDMSLTLRGPSVVIAENLTPHELLGMRRELVKGLALEYAGATSHTVILARSLGIPVLAGVAGASGQFEAGDLLVVDAKRGVLVRNDLPSVKRFYAREIEVESKRRARFRPSERPAQTADGRRLEVAANVSSSMEVRAAFEAGAEGVGVFRTEMLFVDRNTAPSEEEQFEIYAEAARAAKGMPVIIRTLDIGGDKRVPHLGLAQEPNPFLGYRGARIYPEHAELFRTQVRAILRASAFGRVQIMLPMISNADEVSWARQQVEQVRSELQKTGAKIAAELPLGIMIEVPAAGYAMAEMAEVADFFSVGTNDLSQYFFAADRGNERVWPLANNVQPAFLRLLKQIVSEAHAQRKWIGICGEMAGEVRLLPLMLGLGFDEISASVPNVGTLKQRVASLRQDDCNRLLEKAVGSHTIQEVNQLLDSAQGAASVLPLLDRELVVIASDSASKEEVIGELVDLVYVAGRTDDRMTLEDAVWKREEVYSTALGFGFAIPHCKSDAVIANSIAVVKPKKPVAWGNEEGGDVEFAILLAMRESAKDNTHMQVFSRLARKLMNEEFRAALGAASDADAVVTLLANELNLPR